MTDHARAPTGGRYRTGPAVALAGGGVLVSAWSAWQLTWPEPALPTDVLRLLVSAGFLVTLIMVVVGAMTLAWPRRVHALGRRGAGPVLLAGVAAALVVLGPVAILVRVIQDTPLAGGVEATALAIPLSGLAWRVLARTPRHVVPLTLAGAALGLLGGMLLPFRVMSVFVTGLAGVTLLVTLVPEPKAGKEDGRVHAWSSTSE